MQLERPQDEPRDQLNLRQPGLGEPAFNPSTRSGQTEPRPVPGSGSAGSPVQSRPCARQGHGEHRKPTCRADNLHRQTPPGSGSQGGLSAGRLVTLVGPGGVGKTRPALRVATDLRRAVPDGAWLVELGGLGDAGLVAKTVVTSMGLRDESSLWPMSRLIDHVATKRLLLVLDNCEHLLEACAALADVRGSQHIVKDGARRRPPAP